MEIVVSKTPEELAEEYASFAKQYVAESIRKQQMMANDKIAFLAGYQAAKDTYKDAIDTYEDVAKQMLEEAVRIMSPKDQLQPHPFHAGADVYIIDANNPLPKSMPLSIAEQDQLADTSKVMNSSNNSNGWISVKERLPEDK